MDLSKIKKIYMIGIKGVGMTMLAQYLAGQGIEVSGSDTDEKFMTDAALRNSGINFYEDFSEENLPLDADLVIYSTAYSPQKNIELAKAQARKMKMASFPEALGSIFNQNYGIAVAGSHGKTTTTALLGYILSTAGLDPTVMVGAYVDQFSGNTLLGKSDYLILEVDEYQNKLRYYNPKAVLLNNIDYDHPDFFPTRESYNEVFIEFVKKIPAKGFLIANYDDPLVRKIAKSNTRCKVMTYGIDNLANYIAYDIREMGNKQCFKVKFNYRDTDDTEQNPDDKNIWAPLGDFCIALSGRHNIYNALAAIAAAIELDIELVDIRKGLEKFKGTARRMQRLGSYKGAEIYDDYAHHPAEIKATLEGAKSRFARPLKKLTVVFHPHTFTRTKALLSDFAQCFGLADELIVLDIYGSAREEQGGVHSRDLIREIKKYNSQAGLKKQKVIHLPALRDCEEHLRKTAGKGDYIILMGAGDVFRIGENLIKY